ncbi:MAG TPA: AAA family ATPase [Rhodanobacteraceae bacterium]|nr:AAA family ATPase [Rhodanobacteraceae bacterium]
MSIVEKAAEKLKSLQPEPPAPRLEEPEVAVLPRVEGPTVERLQERIRTVDEPAGKAGQPWHVDQHALQRAGLLPVEDEAGGRLADEVRRAKRPLLDNLGRADMNGPARAERIMVTSSVPGEGKTFTAVNLALSLAREPDFEVLLIDADIPKSDITRVLGLEGKPGLMELLADERLRPANVVVQTDVPNLLVLPAGERHPLAAELFGGQRMEYALEALGVRDRRRLLVFDSSPLLATPESQVLASRMGQIVMVVAAGCTRHHEVNSALNSLTASQYIGLLLNMSRLPAIENHHYSHYSQPSHYLFQDR